MTTEAQITPWCSLTAIRICKRDCSWVHGTSLCASDLAPLVISYIASVTRTKETLVPVSSTESLPKQSQYLSPGRCCVRVSASCQL